MIAPMRLPSTLAWLVDEAGTVRGADHFLATLGVKLIADGLPLAGGALTLTAAHPIIARRTWLWRAETGAVIEALGFGSIGSAGPASDTEQGKVGRDWLAALGTGLVQENVAGTDSRRPGARLGGVPAARRAQSALLHQAARFAAAPLAALSARATLAALLDAYLGRRGAAQVLAGRSRRETRRDHPRGPACWRFARFHRVVGERRSRRRSWRRWTPGSTASPAPFMRSAARC